MFNVAFSLLLVALALNAESVFGTKQDIDKFVDAVIKVTRDFNERIETLEGKVLELNATKQDILLCDGGGLAYKAKCYSVILHNGYDVTYANARELCTAKGGRPADILNAEHQSLVVDYVRKKTARLVEIWLGMSYNYKTGTLRFSNGNEVTGDVAASFGWWSGYPGSLSSYDAMMIAVNSTVYGFLNYEPTYSAHGVLCEK